MLVHRHRLQLPTAWKRFLRPLQEAWGRPRPWEKGFGPQERMPCLSQRVWRLPLVGKAGSVDVLPE